MCNSLSCCECSIYEAFWLWSVSVRLMSAHKCAMEGFWQDFNFKWNKWLELVHSGAHCMLIRFSENSLDSRCCFCKCLISYQEHDLLRSSLACPPREAWPVWYPDNWNTTTGPLFEDGNHHPSAASYVCESSKRTVPFFVLSACPLCPSTMSKVFSISQPILNSSICSALYQSFTTSIGTSGREDMFFFGAPQNSFHCSAILSQCAQLNTA